MYIRDSSLDRVDVSKSRSANLSLMIGRVEKENNDGSYAVKIDSETDFRKRCYGLTLGGDFGEFSLDIFQITKETRKSHGMRIKLRRGERVVVGYINGLDVYPVILGCLPNNFGERVKDAKDGGDGNELQTIKDEFDKGEGFRHFSGSDWFFNDDGDYSLTHNNKNAILIDGKITLNSNGGDIKPVARKTDSIESSSDTGELIFWTWLLGFVSIIENWVVAPFDGGLALQVAMKAYILAKPVPQSLLGEITDGSSIVEAGKNAPS